MCNRIDILGRVAGSVARCMQAVPPEVQHQVSEVWHHFLQMVT